MRLSERLLRLFVPAWLAQDLRNRLVHPYWRGRRTPSCPPKAYEGSGVSSRRPFKRVNERRVLETLVGAGAKTVLDVGCGVGNLVRHLESKGFHVSGVTNNLEEVRLSEHPHVLHLDVEGDLTGSPLEGRRFDAALSFDCFEHLERPLAALRNVNRMLTPGGVFIVHIPPTRWTECDYHVVVYTPRQFRWLLNLTGFQVDRREGRHHFGNRGTTYYARKVSEGQVCPGTLA